MTSLVDFSGGLLWWTSLVDFHLSPLEPLGSKHVEFARILFARGILANPSNLRTPLQRQLLLLLKAILGNGERP